MKENNNAKDQSALSRIPPFEPLDLSFTLLGLIKVYLISALSRWLLDWLKESSVLFGLDSLLLEPRCFSCRFFAFFDDREIVVSRATSLLSRVALSSLWHLLATRAGRQPALSNRRSDWRSDRRNQSQRTFSPIDRAADEASKPTA
ncbi:hypothetical protein FRC15_002509 [Serendipita sp. 397]|nr:hypothetical protein FRC15_002509 [Serendipita sp. 397]